MMYKPQKQMTDKALDRKNAIYHLSQLKMQTNRQKPFRGKSGLLKKIQTSIDHIRMHGESVRNNFLIVQERKKDLENHNILG